ncbi:NLI interacting factor-like phosphatase-domain-containing protein [Parasitella parasitica]|nr:NLI interacting factor-like phosphatase-domain-containing protein [Parasitella parasitica]
MSTTFTTALSTPTTNAAAATANVNNSIRKRNTKLFFTHIYHYLAVTFRFIYSIMKPSTKVLKTNAASPAKNIPTTAASQYYKNKTLILDLDETLVHSVRLGSDASIHTKVNASVICKNIEVHCDKQNLIYQVYKRPHVDFFLKTISQWYKVVIYTASMAEYADPVIDWLDQDNLISQRFFRQVRANVVFNQ